jgi:SAM-dependent MidA family methyltransferase
MREGQKIGRTGDFYTSSSVHPVFSQVFAKAITNEMLNLGLRPVFVEYGAGDGSFAAGYLDYLAEHQPKLYKNFTFGILEASPALIKRQQKKLYKHLGCVDWQNNLSSFTHENDLFEGFLFCNEVFDALPVYLITCLKKQLYEIRVGVVNNHFTEILMPLDNQEILDYLNAYQLSLEEGQRMEIPLSAIRFLEEQTKHVKDGLWFIIDYGHSFETLKHPSRYEGTLRTFYKHQLNNNPYEMPGEKDITYDVHFEALSAQAEALGWRTLGLERQSQFLKNAGILSFLSEHQGGDLFQNQLMKKNRAIMQLISEEGISQSFHILMLAKGAYAEKEFSFLKPFTFQNWVPGKG